MKKTTLKDIAKALNTTIATVSRALKDSPEISSAMKERVRSTAQLLNYRPNFTALSLKFQKSYSLGVIFPRLTHYYMNQILSGMLREASKKGYKLVVARSGYKPKKELQLIQDFYNFNVDGLMILPSRTLNAYTEQLEKILRNDVPFLVIDRAIHFKNKDIPFISSNDYVGTKEGITHLIERGYEKIAHIKGLDTSSVSNTRHSAYLKTLQMHNIQPIAEHTVSCRKFTRKEGSKLTKQLMSLTNPPDAIFCINDHVALGVLDYLKENSYRIPEELAVLGFSDSDIAEVCSPKLSTIYQPGIELGKKSIKTILSNIDKGMDISKKKITLKTKLVIRESS